MRLFFREDHYGDFGLVHYKAFLYRETIPEDIYYQDIPRKRYVQLTRDEWLHQAHEYYYPGEDYSEYRLFLHFSTAFDPPAYDTIFAVEDTTVYE